MRYAPMEYTIKKIRRVIIAYIRSKKVKNKENVYNEEEIEYFFNELIYILSFVFLLF